MSLKKLGVIAVAAAVAFAAWPAEAATTKPADTVTTKHKQTRARVTVTKRSYLDAGTTPNPGERHNFYDIFPLTYHRAYSVVDPTGATRYPLPDPFWLPGCCGSLGY